MHNAIQRRHGRRMRRFRGRRRSLFSGHHLHHRFHDLPSYKRHLSFDSPQTRIRRSRLIHCPWTADRCASHAHSRQQTLVIPSFLTFSLFIIQLRNTPLLPPPPSSSSSSSSSAALSASSITRSQLQTLLRSTLFPAIHDVETLRTFAVAMGRAFHPEF